MSSSQYHEASAEPNLTPMLDMVFQLVTFFMLVINFKSAQLDMNLKLPVVGSARPVDTKGQQDLLVLNVDSAGQLTVYNTPLRYQENLKADIGIFVQDSWSLNRLTLNGGLRWEYLAHEVAEQASGNGRFVDARKFAAIAMPTWKDFAPRFGFAYDVFGTGKTALKFAIGKYMVSQALAIAQSANPIRSASETRTWTDLDGNGTALDSAGGKQANVAVSYPCRLVVLNVDFAPGGCSLSQSTAGRVQ